MACGPESVGVAVRAIFSLFATRCINVEAKVAKGEDQRERLSVRNRTSIMDRRLSFSFREGVVAVPPMIASRLPGKRRCGRAATSA